MCSMFHSTPDSLGLVFHCLPRHHVFCVFLVFHVSHGLHVFCVPCFEHIHVVIVFAMCSYIRFALFVFRSIFRTFFRTINSNTHSNSYCSFDWRCCFFASRHHRSAFLECFFRSVLLPTTLVEKTCILSFLSNSLFVFCVEDLPIPFLAFSELSFSDNLVRF